jgi:hypothetical protein
MDGMIRVACFAAEEITETRNSVSIRNVLLARRSIMGGIGSVDGVGSRAHVVFGHAASDCECCLGNDQYSIKKSVKIQLTRTSRRRSTMIPKIPSNSTNKIHMMGGGSSQTSNAGEVGGLADTDKEGGATLYIQTPRASRFVLRLR